MTTDDKEDRLDLAKRMLEMHRERYRSIEDTHGTGVRPSWVSEELAYEDRWIGRYAAEVAELEAEQ